MKNKTLMLYGSYDLADAAEVEFLLNEFISECLNRGFSFVTRNGNWQGQGGMWPKAKSGRLPIDDIVISCVAKKYNSQKLHTEITKRLRTYVTKGRTQPLNVGQEILDCPPNRCEMYQLFMEEVDQFIFLGGGDGVLRLGLLCHFLNHPFISITAYDGAAKELGDSCYYFPGNHSHYRNLSRNDWLNLGTRTLTGRKMFDLVIQNYRHPIIFASHEFIKGKMRIFALLERYTEAFEILARRTARTLTIIALLVITFGLMTIDYSHYWKILLEYLNYLK
jgi:hypothetical protein